MPFRRYCSTNTFGKQSEPGCPIISKPARSGQEAFAAYPPSLRSVRYSTVLLT